MCSTSVLSAQEPLRTEQLSHTNTNPQSFNRDCAETRVCSHAAGKSGGISTSKYSRVLLDKGLERGFFGRGPALPCLSVPLHSCSSFVPRASQIKHPRSCLALTRGWISLATDRSPPFFFFDAFPRGIQVFCYRCQICTKQMMKLPVSAYRS